MEIRKIVDKLKNLVSIDQIYDHDEDYLSSLSQELSVDEGEIKMLLDIILSLIHPPEDLRGILRSKKALLELVQQLLPHVNMGKLEQGFVIELLSKWFGFIQRSPDQKYSKKVNMTQYPVFIFYIYASGLADKKNEVSPLFRFYCLRFFLAIQKVMLSSLVNGTECDYIRGFRYFFVYTDGKTKYDEKLLEKEHKNNNFFYKLIEDAIWNYDKTAWGNESGKLGNAAIGYKKKLIRILLKNKDIHSHPHGSPTETSPYPYMRKLGLTKTGINDNETDSDKDGDKPFSTPVTAVSIPMWQLVPKDLKDDELIDPDELSHFDLFHDPSHDDTEKAVPRPPSLKSRWIDTVNLRSFKFFWDKKYLNLYHYSLLYAYIAEFWHRFSDKEKITVIFLLLVIHTGTEPRLLFRLCNITDLKKGLNFARHHIYISRSNGRYILHKPPLVLIKSKIKEDNLCRRVSESVAVPLPAVIANLIDEAPVNKGSDGFFFSKIPSCKKTSINLDTVTAFLKQVPKKTVVPITISALALSFFSTYSSRYGLDPILACYVSGQDYRLYGSDLHYIHVQAQDLENKYLSVSEIVHKKILLNIEKGRMAPKGIVRKYLVPDIDKKCASDSSRTASVSLQTGYNNSYDGEYGERFIPLKGELKSYIASVKAAIERKKWNEVIMRHNLYIAYCFLSMQFCLAYRPRNEIPYAFAEFCKDGYVVINDKLSHAYREDRYLPAASTLNILAGNMQRGFDKVRRYMARKINPQMLRFELELFFFFLAEDGSPLEFSLKRFLGFLEAAGLPYPFDPKMPRHYMRTYMYEHGVSHEIANAFMGHHHVAKEPFGITSALCYEEFIKMLSSVIEGAISEIGLSPVSYLPEGNDLY